MQNQHQRACWHDYSEPGVYLLTLVAEQRGTLFGHLEQQSDGRIEINLTDLGKEVRQQINALTNKDEGMEVLRSVVMPNHIHIVLYVHKTLKHHLGELLRRLKYKTTVAYLRELDARHGGIHQVHDSRPSAKERTKRDSIPSAIKSADEPPFTQPSSLSTPLPSSSSVGSGSSAPIIPVAPLWSAGYHDRILYGRNQLTRMLDYVSDNPRRGWIKQQHRNFFYDRRLLSLPIKVEQARWLLREARSIGMMHELQYVLVVEQQQPADQKWQLLPWWMPGFHADAGLPLRASLHVKAMGNYFLLNETSLIPVRISRSITPAELSRQKETLLQRCEREGAVLVTPAISPGEVEIMNRTLAEGFSVIRLQAEAMSDVSAPSAMQVDALGRGQLLILAPWPTRPQSAHGNKGIFELLNLLAKLLSLL